MGVSDIGDSMLGRDVAENTEEEETENDHRR